MPSGLKQPIGQKRLTNIAVVRYKKHGKWFEIACYKNKVVNWRSGVEDDLDEVLQTTAVFRNVGKGVLAKEKDIEQVFGTMDEREICLEILSKGELQISEKERRVEYDNLFKDVAAVIADKCVDPATNRPYTITMIERALRDAHFNVDPKKTAKQQAIGDALPKLQKCLNIERARMRWKLQVPISCDSELEAKLHQLGVRIESIDFKDGSFSAICLVEPNCYRDLQKSIQEISKGEGRMDMLDLAVQQEGAAAPSAVQREEPGQAPEKIEERSEPSPPSTRAEIPTPAIRKDRAKPENSKTVYPQGPLSGIPDDFPRKEMFMEIDKYQEGWTILLKSRGETDVVDAVFFSPSGQEVGQFSKARRAAIAASKAK
ncbi:hypothetical protein BSKO_04594 [Bryopsis sp. KO-2023]|nr:hypothetical protein BSKO_04594 [Bryopsis sp. KO-2023]